MKALNVLLYITIIGCNLSVLAQGINYDIGRPATEEEIKAWDTPTDPGGNELPEGSGTAAGGAEIYAESCVSCHGPSGNDGSAPGLTGYLRIYPVHTWDKIYRTMPLGEDGSGERSLKLNPDEVYALTAYILYLNGMAGENDILSKQNLAPVRIPDRGPVR